jgi:putative transposase
VLDLVQPLTRLELLREMVPGAIEVLVNRRAIRTTNLLERLFGEERRRTKVIPHVFGARAVLKLMYAALIRAAERWRGLRMAEFERRQLTAIRNELDRARAERTAPVAKANVAASPIRL